MTRAKKWMRSIFQISFRDCAITLLCMAAAVALSAVLMPVGDTDAFVPLIFVLAVFIVSGSTDGYILGIFASVFSVLAVNYIFTYPYFAFNFSLTGYPLTFLCFFAVSISTCALTSRVRAGEKARIEGEREKMRANLLRAVSHDLRTPLTSIVGALNAVTENDALLSSRDRQALLTDAKRDAEWLINMVENLLSITRMEGGGEPNLHKELQAVEVVVGEAVARVRKQYPEFRVEIRAPEELMFAPMDAMLVEQVLINLLINVVIHAQGATMAVVSARREGGYVAIQVEDDGCGISEQVMQSLFDGLGRAPDKAVRGDSVRTMGIGLSVCRTIVRAHGGVMRAWNLPKGGACLTFTLPIEEGGVWN